MGKRIVITSLVVAAILVLAWGLGGRTAFEHGLTCTKCLDEFHVIERKFLGMTYRTKTTHRDAPSHYVDIMGHECEHVFHKDGYGEYRISWLGTRIGCGMTAEGIDFEYRNQAIRSTFYLHRRFGNKELAKTTLALIDSWHPPDSDWKASHDRGQSRERLYCFFRVGHETESEEAWQRLLDAAEHGTLIELLNQTTQQAGAPNP